MKRSAKLVGCCSFSNKGQNECTPDANEPLGFSAMIYGDQLTKSKIVNSVGMYLEILKKDLEVFTKYCDRKKLLDLVKHCYRYQSISQKRWKDIDLDNSEIMNHFGQNGKSKYNGCITKDLKKLIRR